MFIPFKKIVQNSMIAMYTFSKQCVCPQMFGMLNVPHTSGKILRYPGPSRPRGGPTFMVPPQRDR